MLQLRSLSWIPNIVYGSNSVAKISDETNSCRKEVAHLAKTCFENFGDRVKYWATLNEPNLLTDMAYIRGTYPPTHCSAPFGNCSVGNSDTEPLIVLHNMLLAHAKAVKLYRKHFQVMHWALFCWVLETTVLLENTLFRLIYPNYYWFIWEIEC